MREKAPDAPSRAAISAEDQVEVFGTPSNWGYELAWPSTAFCLPKWANTARLVKAGGVAVMTTRQHQV